MSETHDVRLDHLEEEVREIRAMLRDLAPRIIEIHATMPHLATKAELTVAIAALRVDLADKPGKIYLATAIGILLVAYAAGLAGIAALPVIVKLVQ